jgi:hypothetical protein
MTHTAHAIVAALVLAGSALAQDPAPAASSAAPPAAAPVSGDLVRLQLTTGEVLTATLKSETPEDVTIAHPVLGTITLKRASVKAMAVAPPPAATPEEGAIAKVDLGPAGNAAMDAPKPVAGVNPGDAAVVKEAAADAAKPPEPPPSPWKFVLDANVNYVSAANKQLDFRVAGAAVYEIKDVEKWSNSIEFFFKTVDGSTTDNNLLATSVYDRRFESNPRVLWFVKGQAQWAPLEDYEQRLSAWGGLGYEFFKKPTANLIGKIGAGYSYEFGNIQQGDPQLYASVDWDWDITENQAIVGSYWITPDFADFTNFLMLARLEWTMKMPDIPGLKLLGGVRWQYQSEVPTGDIQNDIRVYAGLRLEV